MTLAVFETGIQARINIIPDLTLLKTSNIYNAFTYNRFR